MANFTGTSNADVADATNGTLTGFTGGALTELQDAVGDSFSAGAGNDRITAGSGSDTLLGEAGDDVLVGGAGNDLLIGGAGVDTLSGGADDDLFFDLEGGDALNGDAGNDSFLITLPAAAPGAGGSVDGGVGTDSITVNDGSGLNALTIRNVENLYTNSNAVTATAAQFESFDTIAKTDVELDVTVNLTLASGGAVDLTDELLGRAVVFTGSIDADVITTSDGSDSIFSDAGNDVVNGGAGSDVLDGGAGNDILKGGLGKDSLDGGAGVDFADYRDKTSSVVVSLDGSAIATVTVDGVFEDTVRNIENVLGGSGADTLTGDGLANALGGGGGNDVLKGGLGKDTLDGGAGVDFADYRDKTSSVVVTLNGSTNAAVTVGGVAEDTIRNIEIVLGGSGADTLNGDGLANGLVGGAGNDILRGGLGKDTLDGGAGVDFADYRDKTSSIVVTLNGSTNAAVKVGGVTEDTIRNIENVLGGSGADTLTGDSLANALGGGGGADILKGGLGKDSLDGGAGVDFADYRDKTSSVVVTLNGATNATVTVGGVAEDTIRNIENVLGGSGADTLTGDNLANVLAGDGGADILNGGGGNDALNGGAGADLMKGGFGDDVLDGGLGADTLTGDSLVNVVAGGADIFVFKPAFGQDLITDFSANDKLQIDNSIFVDWASVLGAARQVGTDTLIEASATDTITLKNFAVASLSQSQVEFI